MTMRYCGNCKRDTEECGNACSDCARSYVSTSMVSVQENLSPKPAESVIRIVCIGHGTYHESDQKFIVPHNVTIRFRVPHNASTWGGNEMRVVPDQDLRSPKLCFNYRLWALTGSEQFSLPGGSTLDGKEFLRGWRASAGRNTYVYMSTPGESIRLSDIVYGLGGASSRGGGQTWEVVWLACREVIESNEEFSRRQQGQRLEITLASD